LQRKPKQQKDESGYHVAAHHGASSINPSRRLIRSGAILLEKKPPQ
jgi:hypothetical protein